VKLLGQARTLGRRFLADGCSNMAAAISYYVLLSLFPSLILILAIVGALVRAPDVQNRIIESVIDAIPTGDPDSGNILVNAFRHLADARGRAYSAAALALLAWSASGMFGSVRHALNVVFRAGDPHPFLHRKGLDLLMVLVMGLFFLLSIGGTAALEAARRLSGELSAGAHFWLLDRVVGRSGLLWALTSRVVPFTLSFAAFLIVYRVFPYARQPFGRIVEAALLGAVMFEVLKTGFVLYLRTFGGYDVVFGSLGTVVAFLVWVYLEAIVLLVAAEIAALDRPN